MSSKTKIVVLKSKELIYTGIFIVLGILLICLLVYMFSPKNSKSEKGTSSNMKTEATETSDITEATNTTEASDITEAANTTETTESVAETTEAADENKTVETISNEIAPVYVPGVYTTIMTLGGTNLSVSVTVDSDRISHVEIQNIDDTISAMYPLLPSALDAINAQLSSINSLDEITYSSDQEYTTILICDAIKRALEN